MSVRMAGNGERAAPLARHEGARVLIVDDQSVNLALLERVLRAAGLTHLHTVSDPREVVQRFLDVGADLVLLDLHMPHLDGFAVMEALRGLLPTGTFLPVVVLTGDSTPEARDRALAAGATDFLTKPFDHGEVILRVRNLLETRALYTDLEQHNALLRVHLEARQEDERRLLEQRQRVVERIDDALAEDAIEMVFQPIADLRSARILGVEALARFACEPRRPPNEWFEEAATVGRGSVLELAAAGAALSRFDHLPDEAFVSINVSPSVAVEPALVELLDDAPVHRVVLELTEHAPVDDYGALLSSLDALRGRGLRIAVDDAGAGYAGLQHVLRLRPDILKLDIALTSGIDLDPARRALSTALVAFAGEIDAVIVAEGIETRGELETLRHLGVPWGQGYHLARPGTVPFVSATLATLSAPS